MKTWQMNIEKKLSQPDAPPVFNRMLLARIARSSNNGNRIPPASLTRWINHARQRSKMQAIIRGLYLNWFRSRPGQSADAVQYLRRDAVVSLNTVLAEAGVLNNPSHTITAIVPFDRSNPKPKLGRVTTQTGIFHFFGLPREVLEAGRAEDRIDGDTRWEHIRATPEKALVDWLYLSTSPYSHRTAPNPVDIDMELLDQPRLRRLAKAAGLAPLIDKWIKRYD